MHKKKKAIFLLLFLLVSIFIPSTVTYAKVQRFEDLYLEITVPEDTIVVDADTSNWDELWQKIGIMNPKEEKKTLNQMGVRAILFDPDTRASVKLISKSSSKSSEVFNFSLLSEEERNAFLDTIFPAPEEGTTLHAETFSQPELPFFRAELESQHENLLAREVIYGTVVNGYLLTYDIFKENSAKPLDESYIKALVDGTHFTEFLDKAEVERQNKRAAINLAIGTAVVIAIIVIWIVLSSRRNKRRAAVRKEKSAVVAKFYQDQRLKDELNEKDSVLYTNRTVYSEELIKNYCFYDAVFHHMKIWITTAIVYALLLILLYHSSQALLGCLLLTVMLFFLILYQGIQIDKNTKKIMKLYEHRKSMEAIIQFYDNYYTLSGIQSASKTPYVQITEYKEYKNYIYLYLGSDRALYLDKAGFDTDAAEFKKFVLEKIK